MICAHCNALHRCCHHHLQSDRTLPAGNQATQHLAYAKSQHRSSGMLDILEPRYGTCAEDSCCCSSASRDWLVLTTASEAFNLHTSAHRKCSSVAPYDLRLHAQMKNLHMTASRKVFQVFSLSASDCLPNKGRIYCNVGKETLSGQLVLHCQGWQKGFRCNFLARTAEVGKLYADIPPAGCVTVSTRTADWVKVCRRAGCKRQMTGCAVN